MVEKEKEFVRDYNASVKLGDPVGKVTMPKGITIKVRRAKASSNDDDKDEPKKKEEKKKKGVVFGLSDHDMVGEES